MSRAFWLVGLVMIGCTGEVREGQAKADPKPADRSAVYREQFVEASLSRSKRVDAGRALLGDAEGVSFLVAQYGRAHPGVVLALLDSLVQRNPGAAAELATGLMASVSGEEKLRFEALLLQLGQAAVTPLVALAGSDVDWQTVMQALDALGKLKAREGIGVMRARLQDSEVWVRMSAAHALGEVGGGDVVEALSEAVSDSVDTVVTAALIGLGRTGDLRARAVCAQQLSHANPRVRGAAVSALARLGGGESIRLLEGLEDDADAGVRYKVQQALQQLRGRDR
ncbi:MAG: HEAT repeat domain-containing protein [bacterium]|nr:HEAT repeat domain-containing protein [bacterium]